MPSFMGRYTHCVGKIAHYVGTICPSSVGTICPSSMGKFAHQIYSSNMGKFAHQTWANSAHLFNLVQQIKVHYNISIYLYRLQYRLFSKVHTYITLLFMSIITVLDPGNNNTKFDILCLLSWGLVVIGCWCIS